MTTHLRLGANIWQSACGRDVRRLSFSLNWQDVTCSQCRGTAVYRRARERSQERSSLSTFSPSSLNRVDPVQDEVKRVLDSVFLSAIDAAENRGYCDDFDELMEEIEVPSWYTPPKRERDWSIAVRHSAGSIRARTEEEALEIVSKSISIYIRMEEE